jgi:ABC-type microcin C transport system permease subunit YejB
MKYVFLLAAVAAIYFFLIRSAPVAPVADAVAQKEVVPLTTGGRDVAPPASNFLKRPLDRTHEVLDQAKQRNGAAEF